MRMNSWRLAAGGAILVAFGAACTVTATGTPYDAGSFAPVDGGKSDGTTTPVTDSGGIDLGDGGTNVDGGTTCTLSSVISFTKPECSTCAGSKCCMEINTCVDDKGDCESLFGCVVDCNNGVDGGAPAADAGGCIQDCAKAHQPSVPAFNAWNQCLKTNCDTVCK